MHHGFSVVSGKCIHEIIHGNVDQCLDVVRRAYLAYHEGQGVNPRSSFLRFPSHPRNRIIALPAHLADGFDVSGIKWIASYPENVRAGIPRASAVLILNRADNGYPYACLEGSIISAARTATSAVLAAEVLTCGSKTTTLGIIGTGLIAKYVYRFFAKRSWRIDRVLLHDLHPHEAHRFMREVCRHEAHPGGIEVVDKQLLLEESDVILFATVAGEPHVIGDLRWLRHNPVVLHLSLRDLSPEVILATQNVVDDVDHVLTASTSVHLTEQTCGHREFITATLAQLLKGEREIDRSKPIVFSPFGMGILDVAVGQWVYREAEVLDKLQDIEDFFFEMTR